MGQHDTEFLSFSLNGQIGKILADFYLKEHNTLCMNNPKNSTHSIYENMVMYENSELRKGVI